MDPLRVLPAVHPVGTYPLGYDEVESLVVDNTIDALPMAIAGHFPTNRRQQILEIRAQTFDFPHGATLYYPHLAINNWLPYEDRLSRLPSQRGYIVRIQIIRSRGGAADSSPALGVYTIKPIDWVKTEAI